MLVSSFLVLLPALSGLVSAAPSRKRGGCAHRPNLNQTQHLAAAPLNATTGDGILYGNHTWSLNATYFGANPNDTDWKIYSNLLKSLIANSTAVNGTVPFRNGTNSSSAISNLSVVNTADLSSDQQAWVDAHNAARKQYGAEPVSWSDEAAAASKANFEANKATCKLAHTRTGFGQNIAAGAGSSGSAQQAVDLWMSEAGSYNPSKPLGDDEDNALHFTAVVWKSTDAIGCYLGACENGSWYAVCNYAPAGNVIGEFDANVGSKVA